MPTAQEIADAVWRATSPNQTTGAEEAMWAHLVNARAAAERADTATADLHYYQVANAGYEDKPGKPADFWNGIRESVRQQVEAVLREHGVIDG